MRTLLTLLALSLLPTVTVACAEDGDQPSTGGEPAGGSGAGQGGSGAGTGSGGSGSGGGQGGSGTGTGSGQAEPCPQGAQIPLSCQRCASGSCGEPYCVNGQFSEFVCPAGDAGADGVPCGALTCPAGEVCCNASCGICTPPSGSCTEQACADGGSAGSGGGDGGGGDPMPGDPCDLACDPGQVCRYMQVQCFRAPCPPLPQCVPETSCADQGQTCAGGAACCAGLTCCAGVPVPPGGEFCGVTCPKSDRNAKQGFSAVDRDAVLDGVRALPLTTWRFRDERDGVTHLGPMAQDFKATFGLGTDERYIATVDADGVALAAIQALDAKLQALRAEQDALRAQNAALRSELEALRADGLVCR